MNGRRLQKLRQKLSEKEIDAIFISQPENRRYLSGFDGSAGFLLVTLKEAILATDFRYIEQAKVQAPGFAIFRISNTPGDWLPQLVADSKLRQLGFERVHVTFAFYQELTDAIEKSKLQFKLVPEEGLIESLRIIKEPEEIAAISKAAEISDAAIEYVEGKIRAGMTEKEAAWEIEKFMRENGSLAVLFEVIVASGPNSALPHAKPTERPIQAGEPVVIDIGANYGGYTSDLTRTICVGRPDETYKKVYDIVLKAQAKALSAIKEGMTGEQADSLARTVIEEEGYAEAFGHGLGHGVGLAVHESPRLGPRSTEALASGMVFTVEPGIYLPGWGGVRTEDLVVMENGEIRVISKAKKHPEW